MEDKVIHYDACIRCGTKTKDFTWVMHFSNAYFFGCPGCHTRVDEKTLFKDNEEMEINYGRQ